MHPNQSRRMPRSSVPTPSTEGTLSLSLRLPLSLCRDAGDGGRLPCCAERALNKQPVRLSFGWTVDLQSFKSSSSSEWICQARPDDSPMGGGVVAAPIVRRGSGGSEWLGHLTEGQWPVTSKPLTPYSESPVMAVHNQTEYTSLPFICQRCVPRPPGDA